MTLVNPKPLGWAFGEILTSSQMNSIATQLPYALDGLNGGTYTLTSPLAIGGSGVTVSAGLTAPTVTGNTAFSNNVSISGQFNAVDVLAAGQVVAGTQVTTGDLVASGDVNADSHTGPLCRVDALVALKYLRLTSGTGWATDHNVTVGTEPQLIVANGLTGDRIYTILDTAPADNGCFFLFLNKTVGRTLTINAPSGTIATITFGNAALCLRAGATWFGQVLSAT
jgi:hypothetical protein